MKNKKDNIVKNALILMLITLVAGVLLGFTYEITKEPIAYQKELAKKKALSAVMESASDFEAIENKDESGVIKEVFKATKGEELLGYAFLVSATGGYGGNVEVMVGFNTAEGTISGIDVLKHAETPGLGAKSDEPVFKGEFAGEKLMKLTVVKSTPSETDGEISAISGATITSKCVTGGVNACIEYLQKNLEGGK